MKSDFEIMSEFDQLMSELERKQPPPPKCHFKHMSAESGDYGEWWYECNYCGHTKHGGDKYPGER